MTDTQNDTYESKSKALGEEFISDIGINGLSKILLKHKFRRIVWGIIVIFGFVAFFYHLYVMLHQYWAYQVNTGSTLVEGGFIFPDITICPTEPFDKRKVTPKTLGIKSATNFWDFVYRDWVEDAQVRGFYADKCADTSFLYHARDRNIFIDLRDHIHFCYYNGKKCRLEDFSIVNLPGRLNCMAFHPKKRYLSTTGSRGGLRMILSKGPAFSFRTMFEEIIVVDGFNLIIHENGTIPDRSRQSFFIETGLETDISMELEEYDRESTPINPCRKEKLFDTWTTDVEQDPSTFLKYIRNRDTCRIIENQKLMLETCKCWRDDEMIPWNNPTVAPNSKDYPSCHMIDDRFFYNEGVDPVSKSLFYKGKNWTLDGDADAEYAEVKRRAHCFQKKWKPRNPRDMPTCVHSCTQLNYKTTKSEKQMYFNFNNFIKTYHHFFAKFRIVPIDKKTYRNMTYFREEVNDGKNLASIHIYASDLSVMVTSESLAYTVSAAFSDFGGNLGLWIGISLISGLEIIDLIIRLIYVRIKYPSKKKNSQPNETEMENLKA